MSIKDIRFRNDCRLAIRRGLDTLAGAVAVTLGPKGRNVLLDRAYGPPVVTKDGVTVAKGIELADPFENMGVAIIKAVATKVSDDAGDGTTTAVLLARAIFAEGHKLIAAGHDPMNLWRGVRRASEEVVKEIARVAKPVRGTSQIRQVAMVAANGEEEVADTVTRAIDEVGLDGMIMVEESRGTETVLEVVKGMDFDRGWIASAFVTNPARMEAVLTDCQIVIHPRKLSKFLDVAPLLELVKKNRKRSILIISEDVEGEALHTLVANRQRGGMLCCAVKAPAFGERRRAILEDIAIVTDATVITEELDLSPKHITKDHFGFARKVIVTRRHTTITGGDGNEKEIQRRVQEIRNQLRKGPSDFDREKLEERIAKLSSGVAILRVGGYSEIDVKERHARVENAVMATRAAVAEGTLPGGGVALLRAVGALERLKAPAVEQPGIQIMRRALREPISWIARNAGIDPAVVVGAILAKKNDFGFDARTGTYGDLRKLGIVDPAKVTRSALAAATSIAGAFLTTEAAIAEKLYVPEKTYLDPPVPERWK